MPNGPDFENPRETLRYKIAGNMGFRVAKIDRNRSKFTTLFASVADLLFSINILFTCRRPGFRTPCHYLVKLCSTLTT
ncbi:MAG: hypothetical protein R3C26_14595 [Calditrichia bacterium]